MTLNELLKLSGIATERKEINIGSNISLTGNEKGELMKKHKIVPGTPEWFRLWFSRPYMTGETPVKEARQFTEYEMAVMEGGHSLEDI